MRGQLLHRDHLVEVLHRPLQRGGQMVPVHGGGHGRLDELRLPAVTVRGHDHAPRERVGHLGPVILANHVQTQVDPRRRARRRQDRALVDVEHRGSTSTEEKRDASASAYIQWVVARRPSSNPA